MDDEFELLNVLFRERVELRLGFERVEDDDLVERVDELLDRLELLGRELEEDGRV